MVLIEVSKLFAESDVPEESLTSILRMLLDSKSLHYKLLIQYCYFFFNHSLKAFESDKKLIINYESGYGLLDCNFYIWPGIKTTDINFILKTIKNSKEITIKRLNKSLKKVNSH